MKLKLSHFSLVPQICAIAVSLHLEVLARGPATTAIAYLSLLSLIVVNVLTASYCAYCMEKGLTIQKISYYEKTAFLWETVAEEFRKEGKYASPETIIDNLVQATKERDEK